MQMASKPERMASVPMTVIGFPLFAGAGMMPVASPVGMMGDSDMAGMLVI